MSDFERQFREFKLKDYCISICSKVMITDIIEEEIMSKEEIVYSTLLNRM